VIKVENSHTLKDVDAKTLALWKDSKAIDEHLQHINPNSLRDHDKLPSLRSLWEVFPDPPTDGHVHIIIVQPGGECRLLGISTVLR
jgi:hypothetical protein